MRLPRDVSGEDLARRLTHLGYTITRQTGSHVRLTTAVGGEHHITVPNHTALRVGTLSSILAAIKKHHGLTRDQLVQRLFP